MNCGPEVLNGLGKAKENGTLKLFIKVGQIAPCDSKTGVK